MAKQSGAQSSSSAPRKKGGFFKKLLIICIAVAVAFAALAAFTGGRMYRNAGDFTKRVFYKVGRAADTVEDATDSMLGKAKDAEETVKEKAVELKDAGMDKVKGK